MKDPKKKDLKTTTYEEAIEEFASFVAQRCTEQPEDPLQPKKLKQAQVKAQVVKSMGEFTERFSKGYQTLLSRALKRE